MTSTIHSFWRWFRKPKKSKLEQVCELVFIYLPIAFLIRTFGYGLYQVPSGSMETTMLVGERFFSDKLTILFKSAQPGDVIAFNDPNFKYSTNPFMNWFERNVYGPINLTKRVIARPGDHIQGTIENGTPVVRKNGQILQEPYVNKYPLIPLFRHNRIVHASYDPQVPYDQQPFYAMTPAEVHLGKQWAAFNHESELLMPGSIAYDHTGRNVDIYDIHLGPDQYWVMGDNRLGSADSRFWGPLPASLIHGKIILRLWSIDSDASWWIVDLFLHPLQFWKRVRWNRFFQWIV